MARKPRLFYTRGNIGSGKTTTARAMVNEFIGTNLDSEKPVWKFGVTRVNRDDFRRMFHGKRFGAARQEQLVTVAQDAAILALLAAGTDVFVDDTNLYDADVTRFVRLARQAGAVAECVDLRDVPLAECLRRNARRTGDERIPDHVVVQKYNDHIAPNRPGSAAAEFAGQARARA